MKEQNNIYEKFKHIFCYSVVMKIMGEKYV